MNRLKEKIEAVVSKQEKVLALFLTAGYPKIDDTVRIVLELERGGADIVELGIPFSDPLADGPVIQQSSSIALRNGLTLEVLLRQVRRIRRESDMPLVLMGYLNPILTYGAEDFFSSAAKAGVDGVILPELPLEEADTFKELLDGSNLSQILLVAPTTPPDRIEAIDAASNGFLYCVSTTGVTGGDGKGPMHEYIARVKRHAKKNPVLVGFGISTPKEAKRCADYSDGVIIGSALIKRIAQPGSKGKLREWVRQFKKVLE
jgi:tryptophan synthase alpha chain